MQVYKTCIYKWIHTSYLTDQILKIETHSKQIEEEEGTEQKNLFTKEISTKKEKESLLSQLKLGSKEGLVLANKIKGIRKQSRTNKTRKEDEEGKGKEEKTFIVRPRIFIFEFVCFEKNYDKLIV